MNGTPLQLALRELRATYREPAALAVMGAVGAVAGITGPFNTFEVLNLPLRLVYWLAIAYGTYGAGLFGAMVALSAALPARQPKWLAIAIMGLGGSVPVTVLVVGLNLVFLPSPPASVADAIWLYPYCLAICTALMALMQLVIEPYLSRRGGSSAPAARTPAILARMPHDARGALSHLSMADHYVEVFTTRGNAMVLLRLADAIRETEGVPGLQIHRSHWVARDAVKTVRRVGRRTMIETKTGALLPVSRSHLPAVRQAFAGSSAPDPLSDPRD